MKGEYEVGYQRPPKSGQFRKGQSGNPKGRKAKTQNMSTLLKAELDKVIVVSEGGIQRRMTKREAMVASMVNDAITNKRNARGDILRILNVAPPAEPFEIGEDDELELKLLLQRHIEGANE